MYCKNDTVKVIAVLKGTIEEPRDHERMPSFRGDVKLSVPCTGDSHICM